jgi:hypothetical protein
MTTKPEATVDDLYHVPEHGKAELVNGELVLMPPTGGVPGRAAGKIFISLSEYEKRVGGGYAFPDNIGFIVNFLTGVRLVRTRLSSKANSAEVSFLKERPYLRLKCGVLTIMDQRPNSAWLKSARIILPPAP